MDYYYCRSHGLCVQCHTPLSEKDRNNDCVRCKDCREGNAAKRQRKRSYEEQYRQNEWEKKFKRCSECEFSVNCGGALYCPSAEGTCLKKDIDPNFGKSDEETAHEIMGPQCEEEPTDA